MSKNKFNIRGSVGVSVESLSRRERVARDSGPGEGTEKGNCSIGTPHPTFGSPFPRERDLPETFSSAVNISG